MPPTIQQLDLPTQCDTASQPLESAVVIGAGILGSTFALDLSFRNPKMKVTLIDRQPEASYKIGESTLAQMTSMLKRLEVPHAVLRCLFQNKAGLSFYHCGQPEEQVGMMDVEDLCSTLGGGETFQFDRRVSDGLLRAIARARGLNVLEGYDVVMDESTLKAGACVIAAEGRAGKKGSNLKLNCDIVCDASGPASVVSRHLGTYSQAPPPGGMQTNAYWTYCRLRTPGAHPPVPGWLPHSTNHFIIPEGWLYVLQTNSFHRTCDAIMRKMLDWVATNMDVVPFPSLDELCAKFGADYEPLYSIGFTVREDLDDLHQHAKNGRTRTADKFWFYVNRYRSTRELLEWMTIVDEKPAVMPLFGSYGCRRGLAHHSTAYSGDGYVLVGDAGYFLEPFWSPGMNWGVVGAAHASLRVSQGQLEAATHGPFMQPFSATFSQTSRLFYLSFRTAEVCRLMLAHYFFHHVHSLVSNGFDVYGEGCEPYMVCLPRNSSYQKLTPKLVSMLEDADTLLKNEPDPSGRGYSKGTAEALLETQTAGVREDAPKMIDRLMRLHTLPANEWAPERCRTLVPVITTFLHCANAKCGDAIERTLERCPRCGTAVSSENTAWPFSYDV